MSDAVTVLVEANEFSDRMTFRAPPEIREDLDALISGAGYEPSELLELSASVDVLIAISVWVSTPGTKTLLTQVVKGLAERHKGKKFRYKIGDEEFAVEGYSALQGERLAKAYERHSDACAKQWAAIVAKVEPQQSLEEGEDASG